MDATDLRALVLDAARAQALRVITIGRDNQLQIASISERVDVNGVEWHIQTSSPHASIDVDDYTVVMTVEQLDDAMEALDELVTKRLARQGIADAPSDLERRRHREGL